jgi:tRNA1Val (adenine37-N6)-methyltransferase
LPNSLFFCAKYFVMANDYFQFKEFTIQQDKSAMKVSTLACILGAYAEASLPINILDIGTGTGLLSLMLAQRYVEAAIDAVEIEEHAFQQAKQNVQASKWSGQVNVHQSAVQQFQPGKRYDLIVSNPPFYSNQHLSINNEINLARHGASLSQNDLIDAVLRLMKENGRFYVLLPEEEARHFRQRAQAKNLYWFQQLDIYDQAEQPINGVINAFSFNEVPFDKSSFIIKNGEGEYTEAFKSLLKPYYLHL